ncbi:folate-binding protein YgfZ [Aquincola sp. S2]|uniref:Folate-binding protein YgfZ n=1 Tax=Pseudaquabacterium terrae TaxID=2732868 RepID=A0ABX2EMB7_9BURK|nr:folate-binding protein YgfZ [Aquabacterium terrae]NRF69795.1 folate-binding protein YgfZ [Aquabacterium terrae]
MTDIPAISGALRLADWGVIRARGADAAKFLHSQLTQDIEGLPQHEAGLAGYCTAKGRLLASFIVWRQRPDEILLACSADLLAPTLKRLSMFVLRAQCKLSDASGELALHGLAGEAAGAWLGDAAPTTAWGVAGRDGSSVIRLPEAEAIARYLLVQPIDAAAPDLPPLDAATWNWLEVRSGIPRIVASTVEQFVPQMINLELVGGVNFQKGCYPGQEIVARSQYRGTLKRRAWLFDSETELHPGQEVFHSADPGQPAGHVANAARGPAGSSSALVEVKLAALGEGSWHAGSADGPLLRPGTLPYPVPAQDA